MLKPPARVVAFFAGGIGDHLLALPAMRALESLFPRQLELICLSARTTRLFADVHFDAVHQPLHDAVRAYRVDDQGNAAVIGFTFDVEPLLERIRGCDLFVSLATWCSESLEALLAGLSPQHSLGFHPTFRSRVPFSFEKHTMDLAFDIPRHLEPSLQLAPFAGPSRLPSPGPDLSARIRELKQDHRILIVHPDTKDPKMWKWDRFVWTLRAFLDSHPEFLAIVVGVPHPQIDLDDLPSDVVCCVGLPIEMPLALVSGADLFLGVDSAFLHAADLCRVPGVGLFGPTTPIEWGFRLSRHRHIVGQDGAMDAIHPHSVLSALDSLLDEVDREQDQRH